MNIERWADTRLGSGLVAGNGTEHRVNCPFCRARVGHDDEKYHMFISLVKPFVICFRCDWKGHYSQLVMSVEGCGYAEALAHIGNPLPDVGKFDELGSERGLFQALETCMPPGYIPFTGGPRTGSVEGDAALRYAMDRLKTRNSWNPILLDRFGYVPGTNRLWILIDEWFWQGRSFAGADLKYISPPWPKNNSLWNAEALEMYEDVTVCEGVFSAYHAGPENTLAICGKKATDTQIKRIVSKKPRSITIMLDAGAHAESLCMATDLMLAGYDGNIEIHDLYDGDPADGLDGAVEVYDWSSRVLSGF